LPIQLADLKPIFKDYLDPIRLLWDCILWGFVRETCDIFFLPLVSVKKSLAKLITVLKQSMKY